MKRFLDRWMGLVIIWALGGGLFLTHLAQAIRLDESLQTVVLGILLPATTNIGVLLGGIWLWRSDFNAAAIRRIGGWCVIGSIVLSLSATLTFRAQRATDVQLADQEFVVLTAASVGLLIGFVIGLYDAQRHRQKQQIQAREQALHDLHMTTRNLVTMTDREAIADRAVEAAHDILDLPISGCWLYDDSAESLVPVAITNEGTELIPDVPTYTGEGSLSWEAFETGEVMTFDDVTDDSNRLRSETLIRSEIILPLGDYGVMNIGSPETSAFDEIDVSLARILAANTRTALERADRDHQLATARDEATQLNRHLTVLNRVFRHDLRNSANVIQGHAELLVEETNDAIGDSARTIRDQATDLVTLSEQVRDIERILQSESYERQPVDLVELISTQLDRVERDRPAVETDGPNLDRCLVSAHPLVESAIRNVVDNAVEHNDKQTPRVDVTLSQSENWVEVRIADNGPGIPDDEVAVLERGYETPLEHTNGLGLWLVSWIVRESGGEVDFQERSPRGSVVSVQFEKASQEIPTEDGTVEH